MKHQRSGAAGREPERHRHRRTTGEAPRPPCSITFAPDRHRFHPHCEERQLFTAWLQEATERLRTPRLMATGRYKARCLGMTQSGREAPRLLATTRGFSARPQQAPWLRAPAVCSPSAGTSVRRRLAVENGR